VSQVALITGGGGGIGGAVAHRMAEAGIAVVIADCDGAAAEKVKSEIDAKGGKADARALDVTAARDIKAAVTDVVMRYGRIDILANIAGGSAYTQRIEEFTWAQWKEVIDANLKGTFLMCREVAPVMRQQKSGRIMNTASNYGVTGSALRTPYAAAKAAIVGFTNSLAKLVGPNRIRVNAIAPGMVITERQRRLWYPDEKQIAEMRTRQAIPDAVTPDDIARVALFLASDDSQRITRQCFTVDGGL
jgi:NAD(P)-dependent dehydrogenase (short-subunit alcohol dehydrogenase family)